MTFETQRIKPVVDQVGKGTRNTSGVSGVNNWSSEITRGWPCGVRALGTPPEFWHSWRAAESPEVDWVELRWASGVPGENHQHATSLSSQRTNDTPDL